MLSDTGVLSNDQARGIAPQASHLDHGDGLDIPAEPWLSARHGDHENDNERVKGKIRSNNSGKSYVMIIRSKTYLQRVILCEIKLTSMP